MVCRDRVVIGASAGGIEALCQLVASWPADLPAAVLVVVHIPASATSALPRILSKAGRLPAVHPQHGDELKLSTIHVAPPDHHLLVFGDRVRLTRGPRVNGHRPAIDPLFRSAAWWAGPRTLAVVLSGSLDDGTAGMMAVRRAGGMLAVQSLDDAMYPSMPRSVLASVTVDHVASATELSTILAAEAGRPVSANMTIVAPEHTVRAGDAPGPMNGDDRSFLDEFVEGGDERVPTAPNGSPSRFTCPECHGALWELSNGKLIRYRCRTGHSFSPESLLAASDDALDDALWTAFRTLQESAELSARLAERSDGLGLPDAAAQYRERERSARERATLVLRGLRAPTPYAKDEA